MMPHFSILVINKCKELGIIEVGKEKRELAKILAEEYEEIMQWLY